MTTISIIYRSLDDNTKFYTKLVNYFTSNNRRLDREHISTLKLGLEIKNFKDFKRNCWLAIYYGANSLVFTQKLKSEEIDFLENIIKALKKSHNVDIDYLAPSETRSHEEIMKIILEKPRDVNRIYCFNKRPHLLPEKELEKIYEYRDNIRTNVSKIIAVEGGGGPGASAYFYECLMHNRTCFIGLELTETPGKNDSIINRCDESDPEKHFLPHYRNASELVNDMVDFFVVPCNTAHLVLDKFISKDQKPVIHIVDSVKDKYNLHSLRRSQGAIQEKLIILGTPATVKFGLYDNIGENIIKLDYDLPVEDQGISETYIESKDDIKKSEEDKCNTQLDVQSKKVSPPLGEEIYRIINDVKEKSDLTETKKSLEYIVKIIKEKFGNCRLVLACTELPLLVTEEERREVYLSSSDCLADAAKKRAKIEHKIEHPKDLSLHKHLLERNLNLSPRSISPIPPASPQLLRKQFAHRRNPSGEFPTKGDLENFKNLKREKGGMESRGIR